MKKLYKLLIVIVFTFFVGMLSVSAEQLRAVRLDSKKTSVGEKMSISLSYNDYSSETESYSSKLHFYAPNAPEVVKTIKGYYTSFDISDDFLPNNYYSLSYLEIIDKLIKNIIGTTVFFIYTSTIFYNIFLIFKRKESISRFYSIVIVFLAVSTLVGTVIFNVPSSKLAFILSSSISPR